MLGEVTPCVGLGKLSTISKIRLTIQCLLLLIDLLYSKHFDDYQSV